MPSKAINRPKVISRFSHIVDGKTPVHAAQMEAKKQLIQAMQSWAPGHAQTCFATIWWSTRRRPPPWVRLSPRPY